MLSNVTVMIHILHVLRQRDGALMKQQVQANYRSLLTRVLLFFKRNSLKSVGLKLFLMFFVSILVLVLATGGISYTISKAIIEDKVAIAQGQTIIQASEKIDILYNTFEELTMQLLADPEFDEQMINYFSMNPFAYEAMDSKVQLGAKLSSISINKALNSLSLFKEDGTPIYTSNTHTVKHTQVGGDDWFKRIIEANGSVIWHETKKVGYVGAAPSFVLGRALINSAGDKAVLVMEIRPSILEIELQNLRLGQNSQVLITNGQNKVVFSFNPELIESEAPVAIPSDLDKQSFHIEVDNKKHLVIYHTSVKTGWNLVGSVPVTELVKDASSIAKYTILISLIAAVVAAALGYLIVRMIAHPLINLRNLMKEGEQGNLAVRTKVRSKDEIGQLGDSFNSMMGQITLLVQQTSSSAQEVLDTSAALSEASQQTAKSSKEIALATEDISQGSSSLAIQSERGSELTAGIGQQMKEVVIANSQMSESALVVLQASEQGTEYMTELIGKTNLTEQMTRSLIGKVDRLKDSTRSIRKILDMLNNMTKQTNILSLNATIEAARAGAAGKGFMVVADEIRQLADQSRQSIDVVGQITEKIQKEIDETVLVLSQAYPLFQDQIVSVKDADMIFRQVRDQMNGFSAKLTAATESIQVLDASQVILNEAMTNVSAVAQESSATSEEVASLSSEQSHISDGLVRLSEKLESLSKALKDSLSKFSI
jgi:methyl-accepting chemotaxis protein